MRIVSIDREIRDIIDRNYARAKQVLEDNLDKLHAMSDALMKYETIDSAQIAKIMKGEPPGPPESWNDGGDDRPNASGGTASDDSDAAPEGGVPKPA